MRMGRFPLLNALKVGELPSGGFALGQMPSSKANK